MTGVGGAGSTAPGRIGRAPSRWLVPGAASYLMTAVPFVTLFWLIPATRYRHAGETWDFDPRLLLELALWGAAAFVATAIALRAIAVVAPNLVRILALGAFSIGLYLLLAHVYAPIQIHPLDGSPLASDEPLRYSLTEAGLLAAVGGVFALLLRGRALAMASWFSIALTALGLGYLGHVVIVQHPVPPVAERPAMASPDLTGNVYHLVLDMMQTDAFLAALERTGLAERFAGFELFRNNIANYIVTIASSASYLSGTIYHRGDYETWTRAWHDRGLIRILAEHGYVVSMYAPFEDFRDERTDHFRYLIDVYEAEEGLIDASFYMFVQVWLASLAPNALTNEIQPPARAVADRLYRWFTGMPKRPLAIPDGVQPYASVPMLRQVAREEASRAADGNYVYAHAILPHGPFVMDRDCRYAGTDYPRTSRNPARLERYVGQAECALTLIAEFLDRLDALGRLDQATIVIHGDTGAGVGFLAESSTADPTDEILGWPKDALLSFVTPILLIKRPHATGPLRLVDQPTQLVDVVPSVLDALGLPPPAYPLHGRSVYQRDPGEDREARFALHHFDDILEVRIETPADPAHSPLTVLGPATDPALWRAEIER